MDPDDPSNLACACWECNVIGKRARVEGVDPLTGLRGALFHPRQQVWDEHFGWAEEFQLLLGKTPEGRATIAALGLNGSHYQAQRRLLRAAMNVGELPWP